MEQSSFKRINTYIEAFNLISRSVVNAHNFWYLLNSHRRQLKPGIPVAMGKGHTPEFSVWKWVVTDTFCLTVWHTTTGLILFNEASMGQGLGFCELLWPAALLSSWEGKELRLQGHPDLSLLNFPQSSKKAWVLSMQTLLKTVYFIISKVDLKVKNCCFLNSYIRLC